MPGKRIQFDDEMWTAVVLLMRDTKQNFQSLTDEAFRRPTQEAPASHQPHGRATAERAGTTT
jgi:hypothetical protein